MDAHKNFAVTDVTVAPSPATSGTSLTVTDASVFPAVPFNATICPTGAIPTPANAEIVRVTNIAGNVLTITRTQESTSARTVLVGDLIACTATAKVFADIETGYIGVATAGSNITWTANSSGLSIDARGYAGTVTGATNASVTANSDGVSVSVAAPPVTVSNWIQPDLPIAMGTVAGNSLVSVRKINLLAPVAVSQQRIFASISAATAANDSSAFFDYSASVVLYTRNAGTLSSIMSGSVTGTQTWSSNATATIAGGNWFVIPYGSATTLSAGEYWIAHHLSTTNTATGGAATTALGASVSLYVANFATAAHVARPFGQATNHTHHVVSGQGLLSTGNTLGSVAFSSISATGSRGVAGAVYLELRNYS